MHSELDYYFLTDTIQQLAGHQCWGPICFLSGGASPGGGGGLGAKAKKGRVVFSGCAAPGGGHGAKVKVHLLPAGYKGVFPGVI